MDQLRKLYCEEMAERIDALKQARDRWATSQEQATEDIQLMAHSLRGTGGTYGFPQVTEAAAAVEDAEPDQLLAKLEILLEVLGNLEAKDEVVQSAVLVVDDDPAISRLLELVLSAPNCQVVIAESGGQAEEILSHTKFDLIILDLKLQDMDGRQLLTRLRDRRTTAETPIVILSGEVNPEVKLECHELGADDYVEKPFDPRILTSKVMSYLEHGDATKAQYTLDEVTGLYSRDAFIEIFDKSLVESLHGSGPMVLAMIRPDDLESLCELHDSQFHDQVIHQLASVLAGNLRKTDHIARWEEDKLVVLLTGTNLDEAAVAMEKVRKACQLQVEDPVGGLNALTVSIGMTNDVVVPSAEEAVLRVLPSVFLARAEGGNRTCTVSIPEINDERKELLIVEDDELITSIIRHRFSRAGFGVTHFDNGAEALSSAKEIQAALVILDVKLPKMDGFEILKNLRKLSAYQGVPVIMLTATGSEMDVLRGLGLGADDYIVKPFSPTELLARAQRMLRNNARKRIAIRRISAENPNETSCERVV